MKKGVNRAILLFLLINVLLVSSIISIPILKTKADYAIKEGNKFKFLVKTMRNSEMVPIVYTIDEMTFQEGDEVTITFTRVEPPIISYQIKTETGDAEFTFFSDIIVVDRDWDGLTEEFENLGYEITDGINIWSLAYYENGYNTNGGFLKASYYKKDGVLDNIHAYNYSPLLEFTSIYHIEIDRIYTKNRLWMLSFLGLIPLGAIIGIVVYKKRKKPKDNSQADRINDNNNE
ncbi:MAG: hypothetical protein GF308_03690 [Candidatus Heimdallarchaeota archaeon]|nr:hypothetical protein [Candidatus Heimdallarchaeota archaeon]